MTFKPAVSEAGGWSGGGGYVRVYVCMYVVHYWLMTLSKAFNCPQPLQHLIFVSFSLSETQRRNGEDIPVALTKNINHRRFAASFHLKEVTNQDQDLYRCVTQSERGSGVSNFAGLIVRGEDLKK